MLKALASGMIIYGLTNGIRSLTPLLMLPVLTRFLSPESFGQLALIETTVLLLLPLVTLNANTSINVEYYHNSKGDLSHWIGTALALTLVSFLAVSVINLFLESTYTKYLGEVGLIWVFIPFFAFVRGMSTVAAGIVQAQQRPILFLILASIQTLTDILVSIILISSLAMGLIGRLTGAYLALLVSTVIGVTYLAKNSFISRPRWIHVQGILKYGLPLIPHTISGAVMSLSDRFFISHYYSNSAVGIYSSAYQLSATMLILGTSLNLAWNPILSRLLMKNSPKKEIQRLTLYMATLLIVGAAAIVYLIPYLSPLLLGPSYSAAIEYTPLLVLSFLFQSIYFLHTNILFFFKRTGLVSKITVCGALLNTGLNFVLIPDHGAIGACYASAISWGCFMVATILISRRIHENVAISSTPQ